MEGSLSSLTNLSPVHWALHSECKFLLHTKSYTDAEDAGACRARFRVLHSCDYSSGSFQAPAGLLAAWNRAHPGSEAAWLAVRCVFVM